MVMILSKKNHFFIGVLKELKVRKKVEGVQKDDSLSLKKK
jgi:hypothetical protein